MILTFLSHDWLNKTTIEGCCLTIWPTKSRQSGTSRSDDFKIVTFLPLITSPDFKAIDLNSATLYLLTDLINAFFSFDKDSILSETLSLSIWNLRLILKI